jgi:DNA invertase Pin-like site-specific DNA recombinase
MNQVFAYLRVSTDAQDVAKQRHGVVRYCADKKLLASMPMDFQLEAFKTWRKKRVGKVGPSPW